MISSQKRMSQLCKILPQKLFFQASHYIFLNLSAAIYESKENFFSNPLQSYPKPSMAISAQQCALVSSKSLSYALCLVKAIIFSFIIKLKVLNHQKPSCALIIFMCHGEEEKRKFLNDRADSTWAEL